MGLQRALALLSLSSQTLPPRAILEDVFSLSLMLILFLTAQTRSQMSSCWGFPKAIRRSDPSDGEGTNPAIDADGFAQPD